MTNPNVSRYPNGLSNTTDTADLASYGLPDPFAAYHTWYDDFDIYTAGDWTVTETDAGATQAIANADGGILLITNTAADDDLVALQNPKETWLWASNKDYFIKARFKVSDATQSDLIIGTYITDTSPLASLPSDGIFFYKADGSTSLTLALRKNGTSTSITLGDMANDTYVTVVAYYEAFSQTWYAFLNGAVVGSTTTLTNVVDDEELAVGFAIQNGEAVAKTMSIDYLLVAKAR